MGNSLRCCLACVLPCGALDLIRIVHLNGYVDEITTPVTAGDVLKNYPHHVLTKPSSHGVVRRILILSVNTHLKRGSIYFLIPSSSLPQNNKKLHSKKLIGAADVSPVSDVVVVSEKKVGHRRARRTVHAGDWRPHLESIGEEQ